MLPLFSLFISSCALLVSADYTWPNPAWDELESITHVQSGLFKSGVASGVTPCTNVPQFPDDPRQASAEWLRTAFADAISHDAATGTGGMDASLAFETGGARGGRSFNDTFLFMLNFYSTRASMADLIALGAYTAVRNCGGPGLVMKVGRVDASGPAPPGRVPVPKDNIQTHLKKFANAGFNQQEMIQMVACGHTLGGVHGASFPELTGNSSEWNYARFDATSGGFDNKVVTEYLDGTTKNPLVTAPNGNNSDFVVFSSDGNSTMRSMSSPQAYMSTCGSILQRMIDTVPSSVKLSPPLTPLTIKPHELQLQLLKDGKIQLSGYIRVKDDGKGEPKAVELMYKDRYGNAATQPISTEMVKDQGGIGKGFEASFRFFKISQTLSDGISSFDISVTSASGVKTVYTNNGGGYPLQDSLIYQKPQSCFGPDNDGDGIRKLTITAAVLSNKGLKDLTMGVGVKSPRPGSIVPSLTLKPVPMTLWKNTSTGYALYRGTFELDATSWSTTVDLWAQGPNGNRVEDGFKYTGAMSESCVDF